jgi:DNA-binding response OmpR family regulator
MSKSPLHLRRPARILITVLESPIAHLIAEVLQLEGYDTVVAASADEALRIASESRDGLIIFTYVRDPGRPGSEGLAIFSTARPPNDGHVVILLTADPDLLAHRDRFHADDILLLPFIAEQLLEATARAQRLFRTKCQGRRAQ